MDRGYGRTIIERDYPFGLWRRVRELEAQAFEGILCDEDGVGRPCLWPAFNGTLTGRHRPGIRQQLPGRCVPNILGYVIPFMVQVEVLILDEIAAGGLGGRIDHVGDIRIYRLAVGPKIDCTDVQRLMQVAHEVSRVTATPLSCP